MITVNSRINPKEDSGGCSRNGNYLVTGMSPVVPKYNLEIPCNAHRLEEPLNIPISSLEAPS